MTLTEIGTYAQEEILTIATAVASQISLVKTKEDFKRSQQLIRLYRVFNELDDESDYAAKSFIGERILSI
jgi:hypothetical protein